MPTKLPSNYKSTSHIGLPIGRECVGQPSEYSGMCDGNSSQQSLLALCISWAWLIRVCPGWSEPLLVCWQNLVLEIARLSHRLDHSIFTEVTNSAPMRVLEREEILLESRTVIVLWTTIAVVVIWFLDIASLNLEFSPWWSEFDSLLYHLQ